MKNKAALYLRLSRDEAGTTISESIQNQQDFLMRYAAENGLCVISVFADDGYSGTSFDRPQFKEMIDAIERKEIDTVVTKDLSRLGRDYIQTGYYLEQYFPLHNVRYIAVNDGIDTMFGGAGNDMSPFRAVFNDMYAKDISQKVRTALLTKKQKGQFIGRSAPYGYIKHENKLFIDKNTAPVVKHIFTWYLSGKTPKAIAEILTNEGVLAPCGKAFVPWNDVTIRRILSNPTYAGHLTQNRCRKINYKVNKKVMLPKECWITVYNTHEAIIEQEIFNAVCTRKHK